MKIFTGFLPKLPIVWYSDHLRNGESISWDKYGVQLYEWPEGADSLLRHYKLIHSSKWDLSCQMKKNRCYRYRWVTGNKLFFLLTFYDFPRKILQEPHCSDRFFWIWRQNHFDKGTVIIFKNVKRYKYCNRFPFCNSFVKML